MFVDIPFCINCNKNIKSYTVSNREVYFTPHNKPKMKLKYNKLVATCLCCGEEIYIDYIHDENCKRRQVAYEKEEKSMTNIPTKPNSIQMVADTVIGNCPTCGVVIDYKNNVCERCGQRIEWPRALYETPCEYCEGDDEVCVNDASPYCAEWCPVTAYPRICMFHKTKENKYD